MLQPQNDKKWLGFLVPNRVTKSLYTASVCITALLGELNTTGDRAWLDRSEETFNTCAEPVDNDRLLNLTYRVC